MPTLADTILTDGRTVRATIHSLLCEHMPTAAVASGFASPVDCGPWVRRVSQLFPFVDRPTDLGLTSLMRWLAARGVTAGESWVKELRKEWLSCLMAVESRRC